MIKSPLRLVVAGIGTEVGKTVAAAVLVEALRADYWKPIQSGALTDSDTETVRGLIRNATSRFHPEAYRLMQPLSPHAAAALDGVTIDVANITVPDTPNTLIVELAGGLLVPLTDRDLTIDWVGRLGFPVILVSRNYLGSINHTLLSVEACRSRGIPIAGILFNGPNVPATEDFILNYTKLPRLGRIGWEDALTPATIRHYATQLSPVLNELIKPLQ